MSRFDEPEGCGTVPPRARKYDSAYTRAALLSAAALRFGRFGYDGTSVRDIAKDAGVDAALVYRYFGAKKALFEAVSNGSAPFEPLRHLPLDEVPRWVCDFVLNAPGERQVPHPLLTLLRPSTRTDVVGRLRSNVTEIFSESLAERLDGPDVDVRAELLAALILGLTLVRQVIQAPALVSVPENALLSYLRATIDPLLTRPPADDASGGH